MTLTIRERMRLRQALGRWAKGAPDEPVLGFLGGTDLLTPRQLFEAIDDPESKEGAAFMAMLEHAVGKSSLEDVVGDLYQAGKRQVARG